MSAPRSVVLDEDVVLFVLDNLVEVLADDDLNGFSVVCGNVLALQEWGKLSSLEVIHELLNLLNSESFDVTFEVIFLHVVGGVQNSQDWERGLINSNEFRKSALDSVLNS